MRFPLVPVLCVVTLSTHLVGCQATPESAGTARSQPGSFWSAEGRRSGTELVSRRRAAPTMRFATRSGGESHSAFSGLLGGSKTDRIPLPRSDEGGLREVDSARASHQPIGAF